MDTNSKQSLAESFERYFSVELAESLDQKKEVYGIRYRVYCEEFNYEDPKRFKEPLEFDEYDKYSKHCVVIHRETGLPAGCVRLVPAIGAREKFPLPFEKYCAESLDEDLIEQLNLDRQTLCEISRLAVDNIFRRRPGENLTRFGQPNAFDFSQQEQRTFSLIAVSCFLAATVLTETTHRTNVFAMMEPFLPRLMNRSGIMFQRAGKDINYHGIRAPYFITTQSALTHMHPELRELYEWIRKIITHEHV